MGLIRQLSAPLALALMVAGCSQSVDDDADAGRPSSQPAPARSATSTGSGDDTSSPSQSAARPRLDGVIATGLAVPWGLDFLPDGTALVSERDTDRIKSVTANGDVRTVGTVRGVDGAAEGGLLGLAVSPTYDQDSAFFVYFTSGDENVIARLTYDGEGLSGQRTIFDGIPGGPIHNGGRIAFGPDGFLYVGTGDAGRTEQAQDPDALGGKILRITPDGEAAPGNPRDGSPVYSLGHRNVQGLAWDENDQLWAAEFGQNTWDELNRIEAGGNYGWPEVEGRGGGDRFVDPARQWRPDVASPSGVAVADGSVFMAGLRGARLWQIPLRGEGTARPQALMRDRFGRLRTVVAAPDGSLWVTTSNRDGRGSPAADDDRILRVTLG